MPCLFPSWSPPQHAPINFESRDAADESGLVGAIFGMLRNNRADNEVERKDSRAAQAMYRKGVPGTVSLSSDALPFDANHWRVAAVAEYA